MQTNTLSPRSSMRRHTTWQSLLALVVCAALVACSDAPVESVAPEVIDASKVGNGNAIVVSDAAALQAALVVGNSGRRVVIMPGSYVISAGLVVPDGITLEGKGVMLGDDLPSGFLSGTETRILAAAGFDADMLTLGNNVTVKGLILEDIAGRAGNVVTVASRALGDRVSASMVECEIRNPKAGGIVASGPIGRAIAIYTRNPGTPHEESVLSLNVRRSIIRSTASGDAVFGNNFAARSKISLTLTENVIVGAFTVTGGVSRPTQVTGSSLSVASRQNLYSATGSTATIGWHILGGSDTPVPGYVAAGTTSNEVDFHSIQDRLSGFQTGILAVGGRRWNSTTGLSSDNSVQLDLQGLNIETTGATAADWKIHAAETGGALLENLPGNGNTVRVVARLVTGSGTRLNSYRSVSGPALPANQGTGNRVEFVGSAEGFAKTNTNILPPPPAEFFAPYR